MENFYNELVQEEELSRAMLMDHEKAARPCDVFMRLAIEESLRGRYTAPPNPWVGAVIVKDGNVLSKGFHLRPGCPHAEVVAMHGVDAAGATLYTTLEPCSHHGRTGPCCEAIVKAGIKFCVVGAEDPDPKVSGRGIKYLEDHGVKVSRAMVEECERTLREYLNHRRTGRPWITIKAGLTIDGRVACTDSTSQWITGELARCDSHQLRRCDAVIVGSSTAIEDDPSLTCRLPDVDQQPLRVVLDRRGRLPDNLKLFTDNAAKTLVFTDSDHKYPDNVEVVRGLGLEETFIELGRRGVVSCLVEGGSALHTSLIDAGLYNEIVLYVGAVMFGSGKTWLDSKISSSISTAKRLRLEEAIILGNDVKLVYT